MKTLGFFFSSFTNLSYTSQKKIGNTLIMPWRHPFLAWQSTYGYNKQLPLIFSLFQKVINFQYKDTNILLLWPCGVNNEIKILITSLSRLLWCVGSFFYKSFLIVWFLHCTVIASTTLFYFSLARIKSAIMQTSKHM